MAMELDAARATEPLELAGDLKCELARRAEHEHLHLGQVAAHDGLDDGQAEGGGLARAGARLHDEVVARAPPARRPRAAPGVGWV